MYVIPSAVVLMLGCKGNIASSGWKSTSNSTAQRYFFSPQAVVEQKKA
jgi:hypothetical protein